MSPVDLKDYVDVKERIRLFYERYPDGRLVTAQVIPSTEPDGVPRIWVEGHAYRTPDDPLPGKGWSWLMLPGSTSFTRGSEVENAETSAWGRAIGATGIGITNSIASRDEIDSKAGEDERERTRPPATPQEAQPVQSPDGGLIGTIAIANGWLEDAQIRETPEGVVIGFRLKSGRASQKVQAHGPMAVALGSLGQDLIGQTVTCWGQLVPEEFTPKGTTRAVAYQVLRLERIHGSLFDIPAVASQAETMFDEDEQRAIDDALAATAR